MNGPPWSGDGVIIPVSSLPTHEGAEIARLTRALAESTELALAAAAECARLRCLIDDIGHALATYSGTADYLPLVRAANAAVVGRAGS